VYDSVTSLKYHMRSKHQIRIKKKRLQDVIVEVRWSRDFSIIYFGKKGRNYNCGGEEVERMGASSNRRRWMRNLR
jgi:hypothetical protein